MRKTHATVQGEPQRWFVVIFKEQSFDMTGGALLVAQQPVVLEAYGEARAIVLGESINAGPCVVLSGNSVQCDLRAAIMRGMVVIGAHRDIGRASYIVRAIVVIKGRDRKQQAGCGSAQPGKIHKSIAFALHIANTSGLLFRVRDPKLKVSVPVSYTGEVPDPFRAGRAVLVDVHEQGARFIGEGNSLTTKCPSKYQAASASY